MLQRDRRKYAHRQLLRFLKSPRLAARYSAYSRAVKTADWVLVNDRVTSVLDLAIPLYERKTIEDMIKALERLGRYEESSRLRLAQLPSRPRVLANEWRGEDLTNSTLLVNLNHTDRQGLGTGYRCAHLLPYLVGSTQRIMVLVEPRLRETFQRTFPEFTVVSKIEDLSDVQIDFVALPEFLSTHFSPEERSDRQPFRCLEVDQDKAAQLRKTYQKSGNGKALIGINWYSSHHGKNFPDVGEWRRFIERTDVTFVSLQYGDIEQDLMAFGSDRVIVDQSIDQLKNMDDFASQIFALDGIITIDSTLAHVAGALGTSTIVIRDDWFRRPWPVLSNKVPWYPNLRVVGGYGHNWTTVLNKAWVELGNLLENHTP
jgi:hypothetical protein